MSGVMRYDQPDHVGSSQKGQQHRDIRSQSRNVSNLDDVIAQLQVNFSNYKYTVYRCAKKIVYLQNVFNTSKIPYRLVLAILARHDMHSCADNNNLMVPPFQLTTLMHDIYFACERLGHLSESLTYKLEAAVSLLANFFWNIYDPHRRHSISLLEINVTFLLLCKLDCPEALVAEFYALVADPKTKCVSKVCFEYLVNILCKVLTYIGEGKAYGAHNLSQVMEQCYDRCHNDAGLTEHQFHCLWTKTQTRFLIYANLVALIKRIEDADQLRHSKSCSGCVMEHITGIRFKCQVCRDFSLCLDCFACGFTSKNHTMTHRMFEVFTEDQPTKKVTHYLARLCGLFFCKHKSSDDEVERAIQFSNAETHSSTNKLDPKLTGNFSMCTKPAIKTKLMPEVRNTASATGSQLFNNNAATQIKITNAKQKVQQQQQDLSNSLSGLATTASSASQRLQSIIDQLLKQNTKLEAQLDVVSTSTHDEITLFLSAHQAFLVDIINEMRNLSCRSSTSSATTTAGRPFRQSAHLCNVANDEATDNLSHSINGADLNRSYLEANKSDCSLNDVSLWFYEHRATSAQAPAALHLNTIKPLVSEIITNELDTSTTDMANFKLLLNKVKVIVEDSFSDNAELSAATQNLENALGVLIHDEEQRHCRL